jgi:hypothetical protein
MSTDKILHIELKNAYNKIKKSCKCNFASIEAGNAILNLTILSLKFLESRGKFISLISKVPGKEYVSYSRNNIIARPANKEFFERDEKIISKLWSAWQNNLLPDSRKSSLLYTVALAPCLAMELFDRQNKKGPATYFECLIGYIFAKSLMRNPQQQVSLPILGEDVKMTMDFLFDMGPAHSNIHLPVKMSTRERVVQAWAHQRLLDSAYGEGSYKGIMVLFSETKLDSRSREVVEICVPDQWLTYQLLLAKMDRIYYFDIPNRYYSLTKKYPDIIKIKQFDHFFNEINLIAE